MKRFKRKERKIYKKRNRLIVIIIILFVITQIIFPLSICYSKKIKYNYKTFIVQNDYKKYEFNWKIKIPKINLDAQINDGTDDENLNKYVAHFDESAYIKGNICLAAHNRGYDVNYFGRIKELEDGDEIIYEYKQMKLKYKVTQNKIIKDTDIDVIDNTDENLITLITCVENQPEYRRCVRGILNI